MQPASETVQKVPLARDCRNCAHCLIGGDYITCGLVFGDNESENDMAQEISPDFAECCEDFTLNEK